MSVSNTENNQQNKEVLQQDENHVIAERREKLKAIRELAKANGGAAFPNDFKPEHKAAELHAEFGESFQLLDHRKELHHTPSGTVQQFVYCFCRRVGF